MKLLLDTHIWLWSLIEPKRISRSLAAELRDPGNELWLSPVNTWEAMILHAKGRLVFSGDLLAELQSSMALMRQAPLTHEIVLASENLPLAHRDPADRFLAATAQVLDLTLVTQDARLLGLGSIATLGNR